MSTIVTPGSCRIPKEGTQCHTILLALQRGERLTVGIALSTYHIYALSQRIGELRGPKYGYWPIKDNTVRTPGGADVSEYYYDWDASTVEPGFETDPAELEEQPLNSGDLIDAMHRGGAGA